MACRNCSSTPGSCCSGTRNEPSRGVARPSPARISTRVASVLVRESSTQRIEPVMTVGSTLTTRAEPVMMATASTASARELVAVPPQHYYAMAKPTGSVDWGQAAVNWVDQAVGVVRDRFRAADEAAVRDHAYRMAQLEYENNRDERLFRARMAEIERRFGPVESRSFALADGRGDTQRTDSKLPDWAIPAAIGAAGIGIYMLTRK